MKNVAHSPSVLRFGVFEADLQSEELFKKGVKVKLQEQPFRILALLLTHAGEVVTREELRQRLWPTDTFVDFDHSVNTGIKKIREALGDSAESPLFIETLPRHGYRFVAPVTTDRPGTEHGAAADLPREESRKTSLAGAASSKASHLPRPAAWRRWVPVGVVAGAVAMALITVEVTLWLAQRPPLSFQQRDWVLITRFENRTGEPVFEGTLEYALERQLKSSTFINVVPRARVNDALRLMRKPPDTPLDAALGREVCLRDGGIRALLTGRVERMVGQYVLSAFVVDPSTGSTVSSFYEEAAGQAQVPAALRGLSNQLRERLGEALPPGPSSSRPLEKATTPSLRALQLYSQGMALIDEGKSGGAASLFEQALRQDPSFASAHILLAHCYSNLGEDKLAAPHYQKAFQLADSTSDRERYFILGSYYGRYHRDSEKEIANYEALVRLYPDSFWGVNNLVGAYRRAGKVKESIPYVLRRAEMRPNSYSLSHHAAFTLFYEAEEHAQARKWEERTRKLITPEVVALHPFETAWDELFPATDFWQQGDVDAARKELSSVMELAESLHDRAREDYLQDVGLAYLTLGNRRLAERCFRGLVDSGQRNFSLALAALAFDDAASLRKYAARLTGGGSLLSSSVPPVLLARAGLLAEAQRAIVAREDSPQWKHDSYARGFVKAMQGELALARGRAPAALSLLQEGLRQIPRSRTFTYFMSSAASARAFERQHQLPDAIGVLERASAERSRVDIIHGFAWIRVRWQLARLYRQAGRRQEAEQIAAQLSALLAYADSDFPLLAQIARSGAEKPQHR